MRTNVVSLPARALYVALLTVVLGCGDGASEAPEQTRLQARLQLLTVADCPAGYRIIRGTSGNDVLNGTSGKDCILGFEGNDTISGLGSNDFIIAGPGDDIVRAGEGADVIHGEEGADQLDGENGNDAVYGGDGDDRCSAGAGTNTLYGGAGDDLLQGGTGVDTLHGDLGDDTLRGDAAKDLLYGDEGHDVLNGGAHADTLWGGDGDDVLYGEAAGDFLYGEAGHDALIGGPGADVSDGGAGNDACSGTSCESPEPVITGCQSDAACPAGKRCVAEVGVCVGCADQDADATCDGDDACPADPAKTVPGRCGCGVSDADSDGDTAPDCQDGCPGDAAKQAPGVCGCAVADVDGDADGTPDCQDGCPADPGKVASGACGCGVADTDTDADGSSDCHDGCPQDATKIAGGLCGCGVADTDTDADQAPDCQDACATDPLKQTPGVCGCGVLDVDSDSDGAADCIDGCPTDPGKLAAGLCGCGLADLDSDGDSAADCLDGCPLDPRKLVPGACGCGTADADSDQDSVADCADACPGYDDAPDTDGDGVPNACDSTRTSLVAAAAASFGDANGDGVFETVSQGGALNVGVVWSNGVFQRSRASLVFDLSALPPAARVVSARFVAVPFMTSGPWQMQALRYLPTSASLSLADSERGDALLETLTLPAENGAVLVDVTDELEAALADHRFFALALRAAVESTNQGSVVLRGLDSLPGYVPTLYLEYELYCLDGADQDRDGICDQDDVCPGDDKFDADRDGIPDTCDACPGPNTDADGDGALDCLDPCPNDAADDSDHDGSCDGVDRCAGHDDRVDADRDGAPDGCDACPVDAANDSDQDGSCDSVDRCPGFDDRVDADHNGVPDACQECLVHADCNDGNSCTTDSCTLGACAHTTNVGASCGIQGKCNAVGACVNEGCQLIPLGDLPGGTFESDAFAVSDDGWTVTGSSQIANGVDAAFRWKPATGMVQLGTGSAGLAISANGSRVVGVSGSFGAPQSQIGFREVSGGFESYPGAASIVWSVTPDGGTSVGVSNTRAFRWTASGADGFLSTLSSGTSNARGISANGGVIVGRAVFPNRVGPGEAYIWSSPGSVIKLSDFRNGYSSEAVAVSPDGKTVVGWATEPAGLPAGFLWTQQLNRLWNLGTSVYPSAVNDPGFIVGYRASGGTTAFLYDPNVGVQDLNTKLRGCGVPMPGWTLTIARDITPDGRVIVGRGTNPSGRTEAVIVRLW